MLNAGHHLEFTFMPWPIYALEIALYNRLIRLGGPQRHSRPSGELKISYSCRESNPDF
jgi:hypothetical protein